MTESIVIGKEIIDIRNIRDNEILVIEEQEFQKPICMQYEPRGETEGRCNVDGTLVNIMGCNPNICEKLNRYMEALGVA
jgi:hypothetical protein